MCSCTVSVVSAKSATECQVEAGQPFCTHVVFSLSSPFGLVPASFRKYVADTYHIFIQCPKETLFHGMDGIPTSCFLF